jgi:hypothetical protein
MGLDQFARVTTMVPDRPTDFPEPEDAKELAYWRKHPNLHGWMESLYRQRGGENADFNLDPLALTLEDLDNLEDAVLGKQLPGTAGFFFGGDADEYYKAEDLKFIKAARKEIQAGNCVYYKAWW